MPNTTPPATPAPVTAAALTPASISPTMVSEIIAMALSDHTPFAAITAQTGLSADAVQAIMRTHLKPGSYRAWRKRVRTFGTRREHYK